MRAFLRSEGFAISKSVFHGDLSWTTFKKWMHQFNPDSYTIVTGQTKSGSNHCVVMKGGEVFCDPITGEPTPTPFIGGALAGGECHWWCEVVHPLVL